MDVVVGLYEGSKSVAKAQAQGLTVYPVAKAVAMADVVMMLIPDEKQAECYRKDVEPNLKSGSMLMFAHGFNIHFGLIKPAADIDVTMIAPKAPGHTVRSEYQAGKGTPMLVAVQQDATGKALELALAYGDAMGGARAGLSRQHSELRQRQTSLVSRQSSAVVSVLLCRQVSKLSAKQVMIPATHISNASMR